VITSEILSDARGRLDRGWCQGTSADEHGNLCAMAAVSAAVLYAKQLGVETHTVFPHPSDALSEKVKEFGSYETVVQFNDDPRTSKQDVLNLFDKAILGLQEKGR